MNAMDAELRENKLLTERVHKSMVYVAIVAIVMMFAALTSVYIIRQAEGGSWIEFQTPSAFYNSTILILLSSAALFGTVRAARADKQGLISLGLFATLGLGVGFMFSQFNAWEQIHDQGLFFVDKVNASGSFLYVITGMHLLHLVGGLVGLLIMFVLSLLNRYSSKRITGLKVISVYWHFLGILWIYLLLFLVYIR